MALTGGVRGSQRQASHRQQLTAQAQFAIELA